MYLLRGAVKRLFLFAVAEFELYFLQHGRESERAGRSTIMKLSPWFAMATSTPLC